MTNLMIGRHVGGPAPPPPHPQPSKVRVAALRASSWCAFSFRRGDRRAIGRGQGGEKKIAEVTEDGGGAGGGEGVLCQ